MSMNTMSPLDDAESLDLDTRRAADGARRNRLIRELGFDLVLHLEVAELALPSAPAARVDRRGDTIQLSIYT